MPYNKKSDPNFDGKKFYNQEPSSHKFRNLLRWMLTRKRTRWPKWIEYDINPQISARIYNTIKITYINHATFLIQLAGINILTDPVWSQSASPFQSIGPTRVHAPGIAFTKLPKIDIVLISHAHYDHLDLETVKKLHNAFQPIFITGLKISKYLTKVDKNINYKELNWWKTTNFNDVEIVFTPAHHWSSRSLFIKNRILWGSFILKHKTSTLYFAGDTGWGKHFAQIAQAFAPITVAMLPIGAYEPRWFMKSSHISPYEALQAHSILKSKMSIAMHFNCFKDLADDGFDEAKINLIKAMANNPQLLTNGDFVWPFPGQEYEVDI